MVENKASKTQYIAIIVLSIIIALSVAIASTLAYFTSLYEDNSNFSIGQINVLTTFANNKNLNFSVAELDSSTTRTITITKPTTSDECYVRVSVAVTAKTSAQETYTLANDILTTSENNANWTTSSGFMYYNSKLTSASNSATLELTFTYNSATNTNNYTMYQIVMTVEAVQVEGVTNSAAWKNGDYFRDSKTIIGSGNLPQ